MGHSVEREAESGPAPSARSLDEIRADLDRIEQEFEEVTGRPLPMRRPDQVAHRRRADHRRRATG